MLFHEPLFALVLFPAFYALYLAVNHRQTAKKWALIVASIAFYTWGEPLFVPVVFASAAIDYAISLRLAASEWARRPLLVAGILVNLGILVFYKYADFLIGNFDALAGFFGGRTLPLLHIALPIGVSFVVFEKVTYLVDCYRGTTKPAHTFSDYCLFVFLFPKLLAGPILKYHEMEAQIADPEAVGWLDAKAGFLRFARGMGKKLLIADVVGNFANTAFGADAASLSAAQAWLGLVCFTLQIYFDFSAYSDMAIGLARMLGFRLKENFMIPYASRSLTEFWRRWHISLTSWIREYLYVPLGGNRAGEFRTYLNLWICFLASGIWHGASWNFVLWGAYNGLFLTLDRLFLVRWLDRAGALVSVVTTLLVVMIGWVIFRTTSIGQLTDYLNALLPHGRPAASLEITPDVPLTVLVGAVLSLLPATPLFPRLVLAYEKRVTLQRLMEWGLVALFVVASARAIAVPFKPFIYFRF
ncbi:MAG TPA: MBOAT family O-acyltransferase [Xanthobacteraceae bacterium]|nr:MBOAT family O-acyltransferase [Xanthobacteraceae bacterium]